MTSVEIGIMKAENIQLKLDNGKLKKEQKEFQDALEIQIKAIKKLGPWKRFWGYWNLVTGLISTIEQTINKSK